MLRQNSPMVTAELGLVHHQSPPPITLPRLSSNEGVENKQYLPKCSADQGVEDPFELSRKSQDLQGVAISLPLGSGVQASSYGPGIASQAATPEVAPTVPGIRIPGDEKPKEAPQPLPPAPLSYNGDKKEVTMCAYLTDVEGNLDYFYNYVEISKVLEWENKETKNRLRFKHEHTMFVFGGDSQDKGIGDIRFTKLLLDLKAQPGNEDRVEFIIGNRDANKLRLAAELQDDCISDHAVLNGMRE